MSKKRNNKEFMICLTLKPSQSFLVYKAKKKYFFYRKSTFLRKFLTGLATAIKKNPIASIKTYTNELEVHNKTQRTAIVTKFEPHDYVIRGVLENKTNASVI